MTYTMENLINQLQNQNTTLTQNLIQARTKITQLETELRTEEIANKIMLDEERNRTQAIKQELVNKQNEIVNYESQKQAGDRIIQQISREVNQLRFEKNQNANLLREKDKLIQELSEQLEIMTRVMEQDLTSQEEFPPKS